MGTDHKLQTTLRIGLIAVFLAVPAVALGGDLTPSQTAPHATARPAVATARPRNLPPAALLAYAFLASSGAQLPQTSSTSGR